MINLASVLADVGLRSTRIEQNTYAAHGLPDREKRTTDPQSASLERNDDNDPTETFYLDNEADGLVDAKSSGGAILSCPLYQTVKLMKRL